MKKLFLIVSVLFAVIMSSCKKDEVQQQPVINLEKIYEGSVEGTGLKVELYSKQISQYAQYSTFWIAVKDAAGNPIQNATINVVPFMDMGSMQHSAPVENPSASAVDNLYKFSAVFIMTGNWALNINITANSQTGAVSIPLNIQAPAKPKVKSFTSSADGSKYFYAYIEPTSPVVGINDMEIAVFKTGPMMMTFPPDSSMTIGLEPEMPSMGHGSPNNISPVHIGNGHYKGKVNFTMTGLWKLNLDFMSGGTLAGEDQYFEIEF